MKRTTKAEGIIAGLAALLVAVVFGFWAGCENLGYEDAAMTDIEDTKAVADEDEDEEWNDENDDYDDSNDNYEGIKLNSITLFRIEGDSRTELTENDTITLTKGMTARLAAETDPALPEGVAFTWLSKKSSVVSVDADGLLSATKGGTTQIKARAGGKESAVITVTVSLAAGLYLMDSESGEALEYDIDDRGEDTTLKKALGYIKNSGTNNNHYIIVLDTNEEDTSSNGYVIGTFTNTSTGTKTNLTITLQGTSSNTTIEKKTGGTLFTVAGNSATDTPHLILENITLKGFGENYKSLVVVGNTNNTKKGKLTMNTGSRITENINSSSGGGVVVAAGGTFIMKDGKIDNNSGGSVGGGVNVNANGTFTMDGGSITGNIATIGGAGVNVAGTFTMNGGSITGNNTGGVRKLATGTFNRDETNTTVQTD
jgi:hypothetical protein